jgi:hypothetical protein
VPAVAAVRCAASSCLMTKRSLSAVGDCTRPAKRNSACSIHRIPRAVHRARPRRYAKLLRALRRVKLLILDDLGPEALSPDRIPTKPPLHPTAEENIICSASVGGWREIVGNPNLAEAILHGIIHNVGWLVIRSDAAHSI